MALEKRKAVIVFSALLLLILAILAYVFLFRKETSPLSPSNEGCLIFQSADASKPCYSPTAPSTGGSASNLPGSSQGNETSSGSVTTGETGAQDAAIAGCDSSVSIERDDCVKQVAVEKKNPGICSAIRDPYAKSDCEKSATKGVEAPKESFFQAVKSYDFSYKPAVSSVNPVSGSSSSTRAISEIFSDALQNLAAKINEVKANPPSEYTAKGLFERLKSTPLSLFSLSRFQAAPGTELVASGLGFLETGNEVHIGTYAVSNLDSADGMTLKFTLPQGMELGTFDAWVTNKNGSSLQNGKTIRLTITDSPLPLPVITGVSPASPKVSDTVTLYGSNLSGALGIYTSLGALTNVRADAGSIVFSMSDFPIISKIKDLPSLKGRLIPVQVIVGAPQGYNQQAFTFNVQF